MSAPLEQMGEAAAREALLACCTATAWASDLAARRPWRSVDALVEASTAALLALDDEGLAEALDGHARIGATASGRGGREQAGVADLDAAGRAELAAGNAAYEARFGHLYLVRAAGRSGPELLALLRARLAHDPATEARVVRGELAEITGLRLRELWAS